MDLLCPIFSALRFFYWEQGTTFCAAPRHTLTHFIFNLYSIFIFFHLKKIKTQKSKLKWKSPIFFSLRFFYWEQPFLLLLHNNNNRTIFLNFCLVKRIVEFIHTETTPERAILRKTFFCMQKCLKICMEIVKSQIAVDPKSVQNCSEVEQRLRWIGQFCHCIQFQLLCWLCLTN